LQQPSDLVHDTSMTGFGVFPTWRSWLLHAGYRDAVETDRGLQLNDSAMAIQMAISGYGVALGRTTLVERDLAEGRLVKPFDHVQSCELAYYLVHRKESEQHAPGSGVQGMVAGRSGLWLDTRTLSCHVAFLTWPTLQLSGVELVRRNGSGRQYSMRKEASRLSRKKGGMIMTKAHTRNTANMIHARNHCHFRGRGSVPSGRWE
jgi:LysR substrate binding domain